MDPRRLVEELKAERDAFFDALSAIPSESLATPGLVGEWSARELVAHLGYWAGHGVEAIHAVENGRADEFGADRPSVDEVNETVARVGRQTDLATVRRREAASIEALVQRLGRVDPAILATPLPHHGITLEEGVREDGATHYREHAEQLRQVLEEKGRG
jgi:hypothetical protein